MYTEFKSLPESSRIWIYQASRPMSDSEVEMISKEATEFVTAWTAHQANLLASVNIYYNIFVVFGVDESHNGASGCSIDKKIHFLQAMENKTGIDFFDRMSIAYENNGSIKLTTLKSFTTLVQDGELSEETLVFNNLIYDVKNLNDSWKIPLKNSWVKQYLKVNSN